MKKIALFLAMAALPGMASAELTSAEADICVAMKSFAETATAEKQKGVSRGTIYLRLANGKSSGKNEEIEAFRALAYTSVDMVFDGLTSIDVRALCIEALKD